MNKTDAVKLALQNELRRLDQALPLRERLRTLQDRILARPSTGLEADKAFYGNDFSRTDIAPGAKKLRPRNKRTLFLTRAARICC
jgi:hypothetical protein